MELLPLLQLVWWALRAAVGFVLLIVALAAAAGLMFSLVFDAD